MNPIDELVSELEHGVPCGLSRCYDTTDPRACMCARAAATITSLRLEDAAMAKALGMAARTFRHYEQLHRDKATPDGTKKANSNMIIAQVCERAIPESIAVYSEKAELRQIQVVSGNRIQDAP